MERIFTDVRLQLKKDTSSNWETNNPVLLDGEEVLVVTNAGDIRKKLGDGVKTYTQLPFNDEPIRALISAKVDKVEGMGLSTNDFTTEEKEKLANLDSIVTIDSNGLMSATDKTNLEDLLTRVSAIEEKLQHAVFMA